jgi:hypothetical protein
MAAGQIGERKESSQKLLIRHATLLVEMIAVKQDCEAFLRKVQPGRVFPPDNPGTPAFPESDSYSFMNSKARDRTICVGKDA